MGQEKLPGLQIARAFAALSIAYFHSWNVSRSFPPDTAFPITILRDYGALAVDFFFAISGFVICMQVSRLDFRPLQFIARRAFRLYPLWIVTSCIYLYLTNFVGRSAIQTNAFFAYCLTLLPTETFPFYDVGWSLQHELAFYVMATLIAPWFGAAGLIAFLSAWIVADYFVTLPWYLHNFAAYYPTFLAGVAAYFAYPYLKRLGFFLPVAFGIGLICLHFSVMAPRVAFHAGLFFALIGFTNIAVSEKSVCQRVGVLLGDASYSIYLIHPLVFTFVYIKLQPPLPPIWTQEFFRFGSFAIICALSIASWKLFERPMIKLGNQLIAKRQYLRAKDAKARGN
jgi:exopolysaccharide production protein ExoZ